MFKKDRDEKERRREPKVYRRSCFPFAKTVPGKAGDGFPKDVRNNYGVDTI